MLIYIVALIGAYIFQTQESKGFEHTRKDYIQALCCSVVWPLLVVAYLFYYLEELSNSLIVLLGLEVEIPDIEWDSFVPEAQDFMEVPERE